MTNKIIDPFTNEEIEFIDPFASKEDKGGMGKAFGAGVDKVQELGYRAVKGFTQVGDEGDGFLEQDGALANFAQEGIDTNIEEQKAYEPTVKSYKDVDSVGDAASYVGELVAGSIPYMGAAMTGAGAAAMAGGLSEEAYDKQVDKNAVRAVASGVGQMALERLGIKGSLGDIGKDIMKNGVTATAKRYGKGEFVEAMKDPKGALEFSKRILKGSAWEGTTEAGQEALAQWGAGKDVTEIGGLDEAFVGGFVVGGVIRTSSEGAQRAMAWQQKSAPIAKNGIDELVKKGVTQDEAIGQVRSQLIESGIKQGLSEAESSAAAARTMKMEYGIEHEIFEPIANDVASRRAAMNERLNQQRIEDGIGEVQQNLSGESAPTADELVNQQMESNAPEFFEQLDKIDATDSTAEEAPLSVSERRELMELRLDKQRIEGGIGDVQQSLEKNKNISTPEQLINQASDKNSPVPSENYAKVKGEAIDPFSQEKIEVDVAPSVKERRELLNEKLNQQRVEDGIGEVQQALKERQETASQEAVVVPEPKTVDEAAHEAATSPNNDLAEPTAAQAEANNYKLGRIEHSGFKIGIENPEGSFRKGIDSDGKEWSNKINHHYGDLTGSLGADNDAIDVFVKPSTTDGGKVFVVDQVNPSDGNFDEHKVMLGFDSKEEAEAAYRSNYNKGWQGLGQITESSKEDFKTWLKNSDTTKPFKSLPSIRGATSSHEKLSQTSVAVTKPFSDSTSGKTITPKGINKAAVVRNLVSRVKTINSSKQEKLSDSPNFNSNPPSNLSFTKTLTSKIKSLVSVPSNSRAASVVDAHILEAVSDGLATNAYLFGNSANGSTILSKGFDKLSVERKLVVQRHMLASVKDFEIFKSVVELIPVDVMNMLVGKKFSTNSILDNQSVLVDVLSRPLGSAIGVNEFIDNVAINHPIALASRVAEEIFPGIKPTLTPVKASSTVGAVSDGHSDTSNKRNYNSTKGAEGDLKVKPEAKETEQGIALFSADTSIKAPFNKVTLKEAQNIVNEFQQEYNGNVPLKFRVVEKQEHLYGPENTIEKIGLIKGSYHPKSGILGITSSNMQNRADGQETLRHEILGHYGLNTFNPKDKKAILQRIINSKKHSSLKVAWAHVDENYPEVDAMGKAEEVFAMLAEKPPTNTSFWAGLVGLVRKALRAVGIGKGSISKAEIESYIQDIAKSIKSGKAKQQTFPDSDQDQFRIEIPSNQVTQINVQDESRKDAVIRIMQDKFRRLKLIQRELSVNDSNDAYQAEEAFHGKVGEDLRALENKHTDKIANTMAKYDLSQDEVDLYLIAKHASERNAYIDTINPELNGAGSGMSNEAAQAILDKSLLENKRLALEEVASHVYAMLKQNREMMAKFGLEAQDAIDTWQQQYNFYVPLKGYAAEDGSTDSKGKKFGTGKGFNIKGRETIKAMGRRSLAESPLLHTISDTTQAVIRARKNEVGNTFLKLVNDNPDLELWEVFTAENPDKKRGEVTVDGVKSIGIVNMTAFEMKSGEEYFKTKVDGTEQFVKIKDPLLARAMGNLGVDEANMLTQNLGKVTRLLSALVTTWNPEFMLTNFTRDVQAAVANLLAETQVKDGKALNTNGLAKKMIKSLPKAMSVLKHGFRDNDFSDADWGPFLKEFLESGAKTGWVNQKDIEGLANELKGSISRASNTKAGKVKRTGKAIADFVSDYNDIVENASRFSVYYHARKQGVTVKKASSLAKNLTINFNRKGEIGNTLNAIYMFANASVQGTANMLRALATPKDRSKSMWNPQFYNLSQKLAVGSIGATVLMANAMRELGGDDEDGVAFYDKIPDFVKATNFIIMTGGKDYVAIPMPYGYNVLAAVGHSIDGVIQSKPIGKQAANLLMSSVSAFSPIGMQESESVEKAAIRTLSPTVLKPFAEMATNENFFGGKIFPEQRGYGAEKSDANLGGKYTWEWSKNFTTWLNDVTGGSEFRSGKVDIAPQTIDHLVKFMGGGVLQFGIRWQNLAKKATDGKEVVTNDIPFLRRFSKQVNPKATIGEFYQAKDTLNKYQADFKSLHGAERAEYKKSFNNYLLLHNYATGIEKALKSLNKQKRLIESSRLGDKAKEEKIRVIEDRKIELSLRFSTKKNELGLNYLN